MYLILCPEDKRIVHMSQTIERESNGNLILDSGLRVLANIAELAEAESVPEGVACETHCYINGDFVPKEETE